MASASKLAAVLPKGFFAGGLQLACRKFHPHGGSSPSSPALLLIRNYAHSTSESAEALLRPGVAPVLPDEVIEVHSSVATVTPDGVSQTKSGVVTVVQQADVAGPKTEKYWAPDRETGVFGPEEQLGDAAADHGGLNAPRNPTGGDGSSSVLEQTAWFRHVEIEEVDRPAPALDTDVV